MVIHETSYLVLPFYSQHYQLSVFSETNHTDFTLLLWSILNIGQVTYESKLRITYRTTCITNQVKELVPVCAQGTTFGNFFCDLYYTQTQAELFKVVFFLKYCMVQADCREHLKPVICYGICSKCFFLKKNLLLLAYTDGLRTKNNIARACFHYSLKIVCFVPSWGHNSGRGDVLF